MSPAVDAGEPESRGIDPWALGIGRLFDTIQEAVVVSDDEGCIVAWNSAATAIFGYTSDEAVGLDVDVLVPERLKHRHRAGMDGYRRTGHGEYLDSRAVLELPAVRKDGDEIVVEMTLSRIEGALGRFALAIIRDVTSRVRLLEQLEGANRRLAQANDALEAFTYVISHDLKEPVRALRALHTALDEDEAERLTPDGRRLLEQLRTADRRLDALVTGLLDLSRASREGLPASVAVDLDAALRSEATQAQFHDLLSHRQGRLDADVAGFRVRAPPSAVSQILGNLIANAIKHNPSPRPLVRVRAHEDGARVRLVVEDDGDGFPARVIQQFGETPSPHHSYREGGFGLLIVRRTVENLGGEMRLGRSEMNGARVELTLPRAE